MVRGGSLYRAGSLFAGLVAVGIGAGFGHLVANRMGWPYWTTIFGSISIVGVISTYLLTNWESGGPIGGEYTEGDNVDGTKVDGGGDYVEGDKVDGTKVEGGDYVEGDKTQKADIGIIGPDAVRTFLLRDDSNYTDSDLAELAELFEESAEVIREHVSDYSSVEEWSFLFTAEVVHDLKSLDEKNRYSIQSKINNIERQLNEDQLTIEGVMTPMEGIGGNLFRMQAGPYRILVSPDGETGQIHVLGVVHRTDSYHNLS